VGLTEINLEVDSLKGGNLKETNIRGTSFIGAHLE